MITVVIMYMYNVINEPAVW